MPVIDHRTRQAGLMSNLLALVLLTLPLPTQATFDSRTTSGDGASSTPPTITTNSPQASA